MRADASDLRGIALPENCSPEFFARDGRTLTCWNLGERPHSYAVQRDGAEWRRVSLPSERKFPDWAKDWEEIDAAHWAPAQDKIAFVRPDDGYAWFSSSGKVAVADADGSNERIVAQNGAIPKWSPDGKRLAFARCRRVSEEEGLEREFAERWALCSLWTVPVDGKHPPELLVEETDSPAFWSPDGRFIGFLQRLGCDTVCRYGIFFTPSTGGNTRRVGPELVEPSVDGSGLWSWSGLAWLPSSASVVVPTDDASRNNDLELQQCVDIWNRARMSPGAGGAVNVSVVDNGCQVTLRYYGGICSQMSEMPFRYDCPSHGAALHMIEPKFRVWNAQSDTQGKLRLFDPPKDPHLPLPKVPPYPLVDGFVAPFDKDGQPLPGLRYTRTLAGSCEEALREPDQDYPIRCGWGHFLHNKCFKAPGPRDVGDFALCPDYWRSADPMRFIKVTVTRVW